MCGGGVVFPVWAIPLLPVLAAGSLVAHGAAATGRGVKKGASSVSNGLSGVGAKYRDFKIPHELNEAIRSDPDNHGLLLQRAVMNMASGNNAAAMADLGACVAAGGRNSPFVHFLLGSVQDSIGHYTEAVEEFDTALSLLESAQATALTQSSANEGGGSPAAGLERHDFRLRTFIKPTWCKHCKKLLTGFSNQGYECSACDMTVHVNCSKYADLCRGGEKRKQREEKHPRSGEKRRQKEERKAAKKTRKGKGKALQRSISGSGSGSSVDFAHIFQSKTFYIPTWCQSCGGLLKGVYHQGLICLRCGVTAHSKCGEEILGKKPCVGSLRSYDAQLSKGDVYNGRGLAYYHDSMYERAIEDFESALALAKAEQERAEAPKRSAASSADEGEEAARAAERATGEEKRNASMASYLANLGLCKHYLEAQDEALELFDRAIELGLRNEQIFLTRAVIYQLKGMNDLALQDRKEARLLNVSGHLYAEVFPYELPPELMVHVFSFLDPESRMSAGLTCKKWYALAHAIRGDPAQILRVIPDDQYGDCASTDEHFFA